MSPYPAVWAAKNYCGSQSWWEQKQHCPCLANVLPLILSSLTPPGVSWASCWGRDIPFLPPSVPENGASSAAAQGPWHHSRFYANTSLSPPGHRNFDFLRAVSSGLQAYHKQGFHRPHSEFVPCRVAYIFWDGKGLLHQRFDHWSNCFVNKRGSYRAGGAPCTFSAFGPWATSTDVEGKGAVLLRMHWLVCDQRHHIFKYKVVLSHWNLHYLWKCICLLAPKCMIAWTYSKLGVFRPPVFFLFRWFPAYSFVEKYVALECAS